MGVIKPRYSRQEFAKRGDAIFEQQIRPRLKDEDNDDFVAIDKAARTKSMPARWPRATGCVLAFRMRRFGFARSDRVLRVGSVGAGEQ